MWMVIGSTFSYPWPLYGNAFKIKLGKINFQVFSCLICPIDILLFSFICCIESDHCKLKCIDSSEVSLASKRASVAVGVNSLSTPHCNEVQDRSSNVVVWVKLERSCSPSGLLHTATHWPLAQSFTADHNNPQFFSNLPQEISMKVRAGRKTKMKLVSTLLRNWM